MQVKLVILIIYKTYGIADLLSEDTRTLVITTKSTYINIKSRNRIKCNKRIISYCYYFLYKRKK